MADRTADHRSPEKAGWSKPAPELVRFIRSLAVADAHRDHAAAIEAARERRAGLEARGRGLAG